MSYLQVLIRAQKARSEARPRTLSRYERPEAFGDLTPEAIEKSNSSAAVLPAATPEEPNEPIPAAPSPAFQSSAPPPPTRWTAIPPSNPPPKAAPTLPGLEASAATPVPATTEAPANPRTPRLVHAPLPSTAAPPEILARAKPTATPAVERPKRQHPAIHAEAHPLPDPAPAMATAGPPPQTAGGRPAQARPHAPAAAINPPPPPAPTPAKGTEPAPTPSPPAIVVEIGQIDIRLEAPGRAVALPPPTRQLPTPTLSLEEYLRGRP